MTDTTPPNNSSKRDSNRVQKVSSGDRLDRDIAETIGSVDNAPTLGLSHNGLTVDGYSRAAVQTYWRIAELKIGFDLGAQP